MTNPVTAIPARVRLSCGHWHLTELEHRPHAGATRSCDACGRLGYVVQVVP